jgi:hypothetical protein
MQTRQWTNLAVTATLLSATAVINAAGDGDPVQLTPIEEVVMYAIDADTYELLRYTFDTDEYVRIGVVSDQNGDVVVDVESMTMIPHGPFKGIYGTPNFYEDKPSRLVRINPLDATAMMYPNTILGGDGKVEGLVAVQNPVSGDWYLIGSTDNDTIELIDPATGIGAKIADVNRNYEGLAMAPDGTLYGATKDPAELWLIDLSSGTETRVGQMASFTKCEALEFAFGDEESRIKIPNEGEEVVPDSWTDDGILFGFDDDADALLIINMVTGDAVQWFCSFATIDCEGMAFTTSRRDAWGVIVVEACD